MSWNLDCEMARRAIWGVRAVACAAVVLTLSCAMQSRSSAPHPGTFVAGEYAPYDSVGSGEVEGWGSAAPEPGFRKTMVQRTAVLTPVTTWSQHWWSRSVLADRPSGTPEPRVQRYMHAADADHSGHFDFKGLPEGRYYLLASVVWVVGEAGKPASKVIRVRMGKQFALARGEHATVLLDSLRTDISSSQPSWMQHGQGPDSSIVGPGPPDQQN